MIMENKMAVFPSHMMIGEVLNKIKSCEREELKVKLLELSGKMHEKDILVVFDFKPYGDILYSDTFDRDINFLISSNVIEYVNGIYKITKNGERLIATMRVAGFYSGILKTFDALCN